jgi:hypothetical protein
MRHLSDNALDRPATPKALLTKTGQKHPGMRRNPRMQAWPLEPGPTRGITHGNRAGSMPAWKKGGSGRNRRIPRAKAPATRDHRMGSGGSVPQQGRDAGKPIPRASSRGLGAASAWDPPESAWLRPANRAPEVARKSVRVGLDAESRLCCR